MGEASIGAKLGAVAGAAEGWMKTVTSERSRRGVIPRTVAPEDDRMEMRDP